MKEIESNIPEQILDTLEGEQLTNNISKISFIFVAFLVAAVCNANFFMQYTEIFGYKHIR